MTIVSTEIQDTALHTGDRPGESQCHDSSRYNCSTALHCIVETKPRYLVSLVRLVHQDPVCGLGGRAGYRAAYRHRGIQESTQGASHASQPPLSLVKP